MPPIRRHASDCRLAMMKLLRHLLLGGFLALALTTAVAGAQDGGLSLQIANVSDAGYPKAQAVVTVEDSVNAAPALTAADVTVSLNGAPAKVLSAELASSETTPLDVVFVIDTSGSMAGRPIALARDAAKGFIAQLAPQDRVAVMGFSDDVRLLEDYTTDHAAASGVIDGLVATGNTALYRATAGAALKAATSTARRRAVILLSDGADFGSDGATSRDQAISAAAKTGVPFFAVGEGSDIDRAYLQQIATGSNGRYLEAPDPKELEGLYAGIARLLRSQYVVTFDASSITKAGAADVAIKVTSGTRTAAAESSYEAAAPSAPVVALQGIAPGESLTARRIVTVQVSGNAAVSRVTFRVDGKDVAQSAFPPYTYSYDPQAFGTGSHELTATVESAAGPVSAKIGFSSTAAVAAGGSSVLTLAGAGGVVVVLILVAAVFVLRARRRKPAPRAAAQIAAFRSRSPETPDEEPPPPLPVEVIEEPKGLLISRGGSDLGSEYAVGVRPVSIGSGEHCGVRIPDRGLSAVEARIWVRGGQLMLHRMTSLNALANDGVTGGWSILDPGDTFDLGPHAFEFRLVSDRAAAGDDADVPDVLRDQGPRATDGPRPGFTTAAAEASHLRLVELMPKNDIEMPPDPEERAG